ncbi:MAG: coproporphyrinogen dehydrogenase HemZ [Saccharofermentanales bacterium]|nr:coproporphyrinogen dehydrogenase HemZ [Clostridiaceae bacterium]
MPAVVMLGHNHTYPVCDVLRLFFGPMLQSTEDKLIAGDEHPRIFSILEPGTDGDVRVTTKWNDGEQSFLASRDVPVQAEKKELKRQLYQSLAALTGHQFPWGSLTGIRPTQVAAESLRATGSQAGARQDLISTWFVSPEKADLAVETALAEERVLTGAPPGAAMVYLGVPFCPSRCAYCSFIAQDAMRQPDRLAPYVDAVLHETDLLFAKLKNALPISAVYVGGGTPTSLPPDLLERLLQGVLTNLPLLPGAELTIEAGRPDTITAEKLTIIRAAGAGRLCINPQTFHDRTLERIGRQHNSAQTREACYLAREMGFPSLNMDLIAGLSGETPEDFLQSLQETLDLGPDSITLHSLAMKRSSRLDQASRERGEHPGLPNPAFEEGLAAARKRLDQAGFKPYYLYRQKDVVGGLENTGYARPGHESIYNVGMMSDRRSIIGLGSGAMSKLVSGSRVERVPNLKDIAEYIRRSSEMAMRKINLFIG